MNRAFWPVRIVSVVVALAFAFGVHRFLGGMHDEFPYRLAMLASLYVILAVSLNLINGITGQFSIGHAAFYMVGAYTTGIVAKLYFHGATAAIPGSLEVKQAVWLIGMMLLGGGMSALAGLIVGLPSLRLKGDYLAIVTLGFGEILRIVGQNLNIKVADREIVAGAYGIQSVPKLFDLWLVLLLMIFTIAICRNLLKTAHGLPFLAVREDEVAASAMGVDVTRVKVTAFVIGAALAGAAGALFMHYETYASPTSFQMEVSFLILTMVVLGGTGSITGSVVGAILLFGIPEYLRTLSTSTGDPVTISAGLLLGSIGGVFAMVWGVRRVLGTYFGANRQWVVAATGVGCVVVGVAIGFALNAIPVLASRKWSFTDLRMTILAVTLIVIMMLRPQGMFAHHELSLDRLFGGRKGVTA